MPILLSQGSAWSLAAPLTVSAAAASACAAWFALGNAAAWQHQKTLTSSCSSCWLDNHALTTSKCTQSLILFDCTGESSWWQARWSALMTCPSPPVRVSSLPPAVMRTSMSFMSDLQGGVSTISRQRKVYKTLVSSLPIHTFCDFNVQKCPDVNK